MRIFYGTYSAICILSICDTVPGAGDAILNQTDKNPCLQEILVLIDLTNKFIFKKEQWQYIG